MVWEANPEKVVQGLGLDSGGVWRQGGATPGFSGQRWGSCGSLGICATVGQLLGQLVTPDLPTALPWVGVRGQGQGASEARGAAQLDRSWHR